MKDIALYIHVPFCKQKCLYCDFPSYSGKEGTMLEYSKALSKEIDNIDKVNIKTIFIGGGTPTYLSLEGWNILKKSIDKLKKAEDLEFTVEVNPGTLNKDILVLFKNMGVNRLSMGLQAWQNAKLKEIGRIHTIEKFLESYNLAREYGFDNINIDLMYGLPGQSLEEWTETLEKVCELSPEHLSCYSLIIEEGTAFYRMYEEGRLTLPDEEEERKMNFKTLEFLKEKGYKQYEISNFSKEDKECRHNLVYWELGEYIGCGSGAHSFYNDFRVSNISGVEEYIKSMMEKGEAVEDKNLSTSKNQMEEFMFMGLRKINGICIGDFEKKFNEKIFNIYGNTINKYLQRNLLKIDEDRLFLSSEGVEISNSIMCDFLLD